MKKDLSKVQAQLAKEMDLIIKELNLAIKMEQIKADLLLAKELQDKVELAIKEMHEQLAKNN